jgi:hypothetical protein
MKVDEVSLKEVNESVLAKSKADCLLYAANLGEAQTLINKLSDMAGLQKSLIVILSDSVVQTRGTDKQLSDALSVSWHSNSPWIRFTHQENADDYNDQLSTYDRDALKIAATLIDDANERGFDLPMRIKSFFHIHSVRDARRNLVRIMQENATHRTWYPGEKRSDTPNDIQNAYLFPVNGYSQFQGMFHIWKLNDSGSGRMDDVDNWHPRREMTKGLKRPETVP